MTETHVQPDDRDPQGRMGRLIAFMTDVTDESPSVNGGVRGIAVSKHTAVLIDIDGNSEVVGPNDPTVPHAPFFLLAPAVAPQLGPGLPWDWVGVRVVKVDKGGSFNLTHWSGGDRSYTIDVSNGILTVEGNNDIY